jgi:hypothetical protein
MIIDTNLDTITHQDHQRTQVQRSNRCQTVHTIEPLCHDRPTRNRPKLLAHAEASASALPDRGANAQGALRGSKMHKAGCRREADKRALHRDGGWQAERSRTSLGEIPARDHWCSMGGSAVKGVDEMIEVFKLDPSIPKTCRSDQQKHQSSSSMRMQSARPKRYRPLRACAPAAK